MSMALEIALFIASVAFVLLMACAIPMLFLAKRQLGQLTQTAEDVKKKLDGLVEDSREMVQNVNKLSQRANKQIDDVEVMVGAARRWTERVDRLVDELGSAIEPPVFSLARNMNVLRAGVSTFFEALTHRRHNGETAKEKSHE